MMGDSPIVIGGAPGSGTRAYKNLAAACGIRMLAAPLIVSRFKRREPDVDHDNLLLRRFFYQGAIDQQHTDGDVTPWLRLKLKGLLMATAPLAMRRHRWGWKNPMTMHLLPLIAHAYPGTFFLLVVRDGRDMAFGSRHELRERRHLLTDEELELPHHLQAALYWVRSNRRAIEEGKRLFGDRFLVSRWEDLTANPVSEAERIACFWGLSKDPAALVAAAGIEPQTSSGRWRSAAENEILEAEKVFGALLAELGYELTEGTIDPAAERSPK